MQYNALKQSFNQKMTESDWWIWNYFGEKDSLNKLSLNLTTEQSESFLSVFMEIYLLFH